MILPDAPNDFVRCSRPDLAEQVACDLLADADVLVTDPTLLPDYRLTGIPCLSEFSGCCHGPHGFCRTLAPALIRREREEVTYIMGRRRVTPCSGGPQDKRCGKARKKKRAVLPTAESRISGIGPARGRDPPGDWSRKAGLGRRCWVRPGDANDSEPSGRAELNVPISKENMCGLGDLEQRFVVGQDDFC